jgi:hypothetical protein
MNAVCSIACPQYRELDGGSSNPLCPLVSGFFNGVKSLFSKRPNESERLTEPPVLMPNRPTRSISSVTMSNGPWVYTIVPWED